LIYDNIIVISCCSCQLHYAVLYTSVTIMSSDQVGPSAEELEEKSHSSP